MNSLQFGFCKFTSVVCQRSIQCAHRWHSVVSDGSGLGQQVVAMELWLGSDGELVHGDPLTMQEDTEM